MSSIYAQKRATESRLLRRSCESLIGICAGLLADDTLNEKEVFFLDQWLLENAELANTWPGDLLSKRVRKALDDKLLSEEELDHLKATLSDLLGGTMEETGSIGGISTSLPLDTIESISIRNSKFCLTGNFLFGPRSKCISIIIEQGGDVLNNIRKDLDFLVIGTLVSKEWKNSSFGNKIQKAVDYREKGVPLHIISEQVWANCLHT